MFNNQQISTLKKIEISYLSKGIEIFLFPWIISIFIFFLSSEQAPKQIEQTQNNLLEILLRILQVYWKEQK